MRPLARLKLLTPPVRCVAFHEGVEERLAPLAIQQQAEKVERRLAFARGVAVATAFRIIGKPVELLPRVCAQDLAGNITEREPNRYVR
jgi:hypothetical protein